MSEGGSNNVKINETKRSSGFCCCLSSSMMQYVKEELDGTMDAIKAQP
jgi:hypothetical protein